MSYTAEYLAEVAGIALAIDIDTIDACAYLMADVRVRRGRVFVLGVGGSAANASHLVNDLRKMARLEAYAPTDNVAELTARTNDDGWPRVFADWLCISRLTRDDLLVILSVGGGTAEASPNLIVAIDFAHERGARVIAIVGRANGYAARTADVCVLIPEVSDKHVTPHAESFQSVLAHLLVWHPALA